VNQCQTLGKGPGGFYQPQVGVNGKMNLQLMCLGMQWQPATKSYSTHRSHHDNAVAPEIPASFMRLVDKALMTARVAATQDTGGKTKRVQVAKDSAVPEMVPNVCIVNFYERSGTLGMHQVRIEFWFLFL
jgi:alkylated DNA repair dioxygenase AlkB